MQNVICLFAGIKVKINYPYPSFERFAAGYLLPVDAAFDMEITVSEADVLRERDGAEGNYSDAYLQTLAVYRKFCTAAAERGVLLFHGSALAMDGNAYIFSAPSGTGKSTHAALWRKVFGNRVQMINDDKPLLRFFEKETLVYGTPWNGKHHLGGNFSAPLKGICFLERGQKNAVRALTARESLTRLLSQCFLPDDESAAQAVLSMVKEIVQKTPIWLLTCNISEEAARISCATLTGKREWLSEEDINGQTEEFTRE